MVFFLRPISGIEDKQTENVPQLWNNANLAGSFLLERMKDCFICRTAEISSLVANRTTF